MSLYVPVPHLLFSVIRDAHYTLLVCGKLYTVLFHFRQITLKENILPALLSSMQISHYAHFLRILWVACDYRHEQPAE